MLEVVGSNLTEGKFFHISLYLEWKLKKLLAILLLLCEPAFHISMLRHNNVCVVAGVCGIACFVICAFAPVFPLYFASYAIFQGITKLFMCMNM